MRPMKKIMNTPLRSSVLDNDLQKGRITELEESNAIYFIYELLTNILASIIDHYEFEFKIPFKVYFPKEWEVFPPSANIKIRLHGIDLTLTDQNKILECELQRLREIYKKTLINPRVQTSWGYDKGLGYDDINLLTGKSIPTIKRAANKGKLGNSIERRDKKKFYSLDAVIKWNWKPKANNIIVKSSKTREIIILWRLLFMPRELTKNIRLPKYSCKTTFKDARVCELSKKLYPCLPKPSNEFMNLMTSFTNGQIRYIQGLLIHLDSIFSQKRNPQDEKIYFDLIYGKLFEYQKRKNPTLNNHETYVLVKGFLNQILAPSKLVCQTCQIKGKWIDKNRTSYVVDTDEKWKDDELSNDDNSNFNIEVKCPECGMCWYPIDQDLESYTIAKTVSSDIGLTLNELESLRRIKRHDAKKGMVDLKPFLTDIGKILGCSKAAVCQIFNQLKYDNMAMSKIGFIVTALHYRSHGVYFPLIYIFPNSIIAAIDKEIRWFNSNND